MKIDKQDGGIKMLIAVIYLTLWLIMLFSIFGVGTYLFTEHLKAITWLAVGIFSYYMQRKIYKFMQQ